jgi:hypothetical protein
MGTQITKTFAKKSAVVWRKSVFWYGEKTTEMGTRGSRVLSSR